ncbi:hypothetical protein AAMO2058_001329000 [Amorphochlora amoebiformis]|uniref:Secreted protein n=1 Tax=Amorphochlora amoebiformis TaxID=1561963 RepID=A0A7S0DFH5_9EUKA|eukprot:1043124-Amorphochlora_amoeboformis.AAC.3
MKLVVLAICCLAVFSRAVEVTRLHPEFVAVYLNATTHYGDPKTGCMSDEVAVQIQGIKGDFCSPKCSFVKSCPTDVPSGVTATPQCALQSTTGDQYCALLCTSADDAQCGSNASCKPIQGLGICTYDD